MSNIDEALITQILCYFERIYSTLRKIDFSLDALVKEMVEDSKCNMCCNSYKQRDRERKNETI